MQILSQRSMFWVKTFARKVKYQFESTITQLKVFGWIACRKIVVVSVRRITSSVLMVMAVYQESMCTFDSKFNLQ